jgi:hypothetical protein
MLNVVADGAATVSDRVVGTVVDTVRDRADELMTHMEDRVMGLRARLMRSTFGSVLLGTGILLLFTALILWLVLSVRISLPLAFVILGVAVIIASLIAFATARRMYG